MFDSAEIATFTPEEIVKYQEDMTTERDIRNQIAYAEEKGMEKGRAEGREEVMAIKQKIFDELRSKGVDEKLLNEVFEKYHQ